MSVNVGLPESSFVAVVPLIAAHLTFVLPTFISYAQLT